MENYLKIIIKIFRKLLDKIKQLWYNVGKIKIVVYEKGVRQHECFTKNFNR